MQSVEILTDIPDEPALASIDSGLRTERYQTPVEEFLTGNLQSHLLQTIPVQYKISVMLEIRNNLNSMPLAIKASSVEEPVILENR